MPEAVASNSRAVPERQPSEWTTSGILDALSEAEDAIYALGDMAVFDMERNGDPKVAAGFSYLIRRETEELAEIRKALRTLLLKTPQGHLDRANASMKQAIWSELFLKVSGIVQQTMEDAGRYVPETNALLWSEEDSTEALKVTLTHYQLIVDRLGGSDDPFEAGSLLPWAELLIRKEFGSLPQAMSAEPVSPKSMRDQFIAEKHREGRTPSEISQALSLRQSTVLRTIDRLTGMVEEVDRKAI
jgi:hypothetical protein